MEGPSGLLKEASGAQALKAWDAESVWLKVENILWGQKSVINLNHYMKIWLVSF